MFAGFEKITPLSRAIDIYVTKLKQVRFATLSGLLRCGVLAELGLLSNEKSPSAVITDGLRQHEGVSGFRGEGRGG